MNTCRPFHSEATQAHKIQVKDLHTRATFLFLSMRSLFQGGNGRLLEPLSSPASFPSL